MIPPLKNLKGNVSQSTKARCENCNAEEGAEHPIKGMQIKLKKIKVQSEEKQYCQICLILNSTKTVEEKEVKLLQLTKRVGF